MLICDVLAFTEVSEGYLFLLHASLRHCKDRLLCCPVTEAFQLVKATDPRLQVLQKTSRPMPFKTSQ